MAEVTRDPQPKGVGTATRLGVGGFVTLIVALVPDVDPLLATGALALVGPAVGWIGATARDFIHDREIEKPSVGLWLASRLD